MSEFLGPYTYFLLGFSLLASIFWVRWQTQFIRARPTQVSRALRFGIVDLWALAVPLFLISLVIVAAVKAPSPLLLLIPVPPCVLIWLHGIIMLNRAGEQLRYERFLFLGLLLPLAYAGSYFLALILFIIVVSSLETRNFFYSGVLLSLVIWFVLVYAFTLFVKACMNALGRFK